MRSHPAYFAFWFPSITLCAIVTGYFIVMWANAPEIPSEGMEALIGLPYGFATVTMAPFIVALAVFLWFHPRSSALKARVSVPTVGLTSIAVLAFYLTPKASEATYDFPLIFVDTSGQPVSDLHLAVTHSSPGFDMIRGRQTRREEEYHVSSHEFILTKEKGEETKMKIEKDGYYLTRVDIPHVWPAARERGLQRIHLGWQKDWSGGRWGVDACQAAMNWPLKSETPFRVVMLELSRPAESPFPEYSDEDFRQLQNANK